MTTVAQDLESFTMSTAAADYVTWERYYLIDSAGGDSTIGTNSIGGPCLNVAGNTPHWWRRRIFAPGGLVTGTRGGRCLVSKGILYWTWWDSANAAVQCSVEFDATNGQVRAYTGCRDTFMPGSGTGTLIAQSALMSVQTGSEFYAEAGVTIATGTGGSILVKINGVTLINQSGVATQSTGTAAYHTTQDATSGQVGSGGAATVQQSDLYWTSGTTYYGPGKVFGLFPASNGTVQFTPSTGSNYQNVSHQPPVGDAGYNYSATTGQSDLFNTTAGASGTAVKAAMLTRNSRVDAAGTHTAKSLLKSGTTTFSGATTSENSGYTSWFDPMDNDPNTSSPFTISAVNSAEIGYDLVT